MNKLKCYLSRLYNLERLIIVDIADVGDVARSVIEARMTESWSLG